MKKRILVICCLLTHAAAMVGAAEDIIDDKVIIKGEQKKRVSAEKLPIRHEFNIDKVLTFDMEPVKDIYYYHASLPGDDAYVSVPSYRPIDPLAGIAVHDIITGPYVKKFMPEDFKRAKTWVLTILDAQGREVKKYSSFTVKSKKGIYWNGRDDAGAMLKAGYPYSSIFKWSSRKTKMDAAGTVQWQKEGLYRQTDIGESFSINAFFYRENETRKIILTNDILFKEADLSTGEENSINEDMLNQAAVLVRDYFIEPVNITVHAQDEEEALRQADMIKKMLAEKLIIEPDRFTVRGLTAQDNISYTEIVLGK